MDSVEARLASTTAELRSISDQLERQYQRVGTLMEPYLGTDHEDVIGALQEAERQVGIAQRAIDRSVRTIEARGTC